MTRIALDPLETGARQALATVWRVLPEARLVGGVVRDLIAGDAAADLDLGIPETPEIVARRLADAGIRCLPTGVAHGTVTALVEGRGIEITSLRRDEETDGRHAVVAWTTDWREDAQRRDFTINAMSLNRDGTLFDYFDGRADLAAGRVRFVGPAARRIAEDGLRILRFFRFNARYGGDFPDADAARGITESLPSLDRLSAERVWSELRRILIGPRLDMTLALMRRLGVLDRLFPCGVTEGLPGRVPADPILRLAALICGPALSVARALRLSNADAERLEAMLATPAPRPGLDDANLRRVLADAPAELLCDVAWLAEARSNGHAEAWRDLRRRLRATPRPVFPLRGRDGLDCGIAPGPELGRLLTLTRDWWLSGGCVAGRAACLERLHDLMERPAG